MGMAVIKRQRDSLHGPVVSQSGTWTSLSNGYVLTGEARGYYPTISCDGSVYHNLNCDYVEAVGFRQWETVQIPTSEWALWRLVLMFGDLQLATKRLRTRKVLV